MVDDQSKPDFGAHDMGPFCPNERQTISAHYKFPPEVLAHPETLLSWAKEAVRVVMAS